MGWSRKAIPDKRCNMNKAIVVGIHKVCFKQSDYPLRWKNRIDAQKER